MSLPVKLKDVVDALDVGTDEITTYLDKRTGEICLITDEEMSAVENNQPLDNYPEWQQNSVRKTKEILIDPDNFAALPSQFEIHEYSIMEEFGQRLEDSRRGGELLRSISGKGAFRRFRDTLHDLGIQDKWYEFRREKFEEIAIEWLESERIPYTLEDEKADDAG